MEVSLFIPCTVDVLLPEIGIATCRVLERLGVKTVYHESQTCCGQVFLNAGHAQKARRAACRFIEIFSKDDFVVSPSGSCVHMVRSCYPDLFPAGSVWRARALDLAPRVFELSQFLVDVMGVTDPGGSFDATVTYHDSCHVLRGLGVSRQARMLVDAAAGPRRVEMPGADSCCGFGGEFSVRFPEISVAILKDKVQSFLDSRADVLVLNEPGCLLNIGGYLHRHHPEKKVMHLAVFLDEAMERGGGR